MFVDGGSRPPSSSEITVSRAARWSVPHPPPPPVQPRGVPTYHKRGNPGKGLTRTGRGRRGPTTMGGGALHSLPNPAAPGLNTNWSHELPARHRRRRRRQQHFLREVPAGIGLSSLRALALAARSSTSTVSSRLRPARVPRSTSRACTSPPTLARGASAHCSRSPVPAPGDAGRYSPRRTRGDKDPLHVPGCRPKRSLSTIPVEPPSRVSSGHRACDSRNTSLRCFQSSVLLLLLPAARRRVR